MIEPGDILEVVYNSDADAIYPEITKGQKFICNNTIQCSCGKEGGVDIGLRKRSNGPTHCESCGKAITGATNVAYFESRFFRKIPPPYKAVRVSEEILKQTRKLILQ